MGWFARHGYLASRRGKCLKYLFGKEFEDYRSRAEKEFGIRMLRGTKVASIDEDPETKNLILRYSNGTETNTEEFDLVVLSVGFEPPASVHDLAKTICFKLNKYGFAETGVHAPLDTSRPGVYVIGAFGAPKDIPQSVAEASGTALKARTQVYQNRVHYVAPEIPEMNVIDRNQGSASSLVASISTSAVP